MICVNCFHAAGMLLLCCWYDCAQQMAELADRVRDIIEHQNYICHLVCHITHKQKEDTHEANPNVMILRFAFPQQTKNTNKPIPN